MRRAASAIFLGLLTGFALSTAVCRAQGDPWFDEDPAPSPSAAPTPDAAPAPEPADAEEPAPVHEAKRRTKRAKATPERKVDGEGDPPTLLGHDGKLAFGGYGGVTVLGSRVNGTWGALVGGEAAFLLDHRLAIGFSGVGLASQVEGPRASDGTLSRVQFGYGGVMLELNLVARSPVYVAVGGMVGGGAVAFCGYGTQRWDVDCRQENLDQSAFFVAEPRVGLRANVTRWMRLGADARYRFTEGVSTRGLGDSDFSGASVGGSIEFGWF